MKRSWRKTIIGGLSFGTALFVFQACYGTPQDMDFTDQVPVVGQVYAKSTGEPLDSIRVWERSTRQYGISDEHGYFEFYIPRMDSTLLHIEALEDKSGPDYQRIDTLVEHPGYAIELDLALEEI